MNQRVRAQIKTLEHRFQVKSGDVALNLRFGLLQILGTAVSSDWRVFDVSVLL